MKTRLTFSYDPECDPVGAERVRRMMKADDMIYVLWHLVHDDTVPEDTRREVAAWCHDNNIHFEELYT